MTLDDNVFYELLGNDRRRACLERLAESEREWSVRELAKAVADDVTDPSTSSADIYDSVYISLCQNHLPKLDSVGLIEYDHDEKTVKRGSNFDEVEQRLRMGSGSESSVTRSVVVATSVVTVALAGATAAAPTASNYLLAVILTLHIGVILLVGIGQLRATGR